MPNGQHARQLRAAADDARGREALPGAALAGASSWTKCRALAEAAGHLLKFLVRTARDAALGSTGVVV